MTNKHVKKLSNGDAQNNSKNIVDILATDKEISTNVLNRAEKRINELEERAKNSFTQEEVLVIKQKLELLKFNYKMLKDKHEEKNPNNVKKDNIVSFQAVESPKLYSNPKDAIQDLEDDSNNIVVTEESIDNDTRKVGTYGRSYDSGFRGYTKKEVKEIERLIPDVHTPVTISSKNFSKKFSLTGNDLHM